ncbi:MAG TPA: lamin tail domain-containing protein, partial [Bacteroidales bacterium]|nr:lamin tail domain-containing protein [Bacteroidales bacterium]
NASGVIVDSVMFDDASPWPTAADQGGYSLSLCDPSLDNNNGANWGLGTVFFATVNSLDVYADPGQGCVVPVDNIPPVVDTAFATNLNTIKVVFNEVVDNITSETIANYTGLAGIGAASLNATMDTVTLTLSTPLLDNVADTIHIAGIEDTAGNVMATTQSFRLIFSIADIIPPTVINAWPETHAVVKVKFSEAMDDVTAETVANYTGLAGIGSATLNSTMDTVTLALSINLINGVADTLYVQNVEDTAGNAMTAQQMFVLMLDTVTTPKALVITEIMYNPIEGTLDTTEFIEIYNNDITSVDLLGYTLTYNTNAFTFPTSVVLNPGEYALVASNATAATAFYGMPFIQGNTVGVSNNGTVVKLKSANGLLVDSLVYDDVSPWDTLADGDGYSLTLCDPDLDNTVAANWSLGTVLYGTSTYADPGQGCVTPVDTVAPVALHASLTNLTTAVVTFNESLNMTSAQTTSHYTGLGTVSSAVLSNDTVVTLTLATALVNAQSYTLSVTGISDLESNVMTITYEFPLMLDTTTSISEMTNAAIQIFPNPANDVITVTGTATASRIEMYNNMGMLVLSREADGIDSITIETSTLENGSYYINIRMNDGAVVTRPVVIIR